MRSLFRVAFALAALAGALAAQQVRVLPIAEPKTAVLGETVLYALDVTVVSTDGKPVAAPEFVDLPEIPGVVSKPSRVLDRGVQQQMSIINGRRSTQVEYHWQVIWELQPAEVGSYRVPAFDYDYLGAKRSIRPFPFEVVKEAPGNRWVTLAVSATPEDPYVNQPVTLRFVLTSRRDIDPGFKPKVELPWARSANGFSGVAPEPGWTGGRHTVVELNGENFDFLKQTSRGEIAETMSFERTIYPIAPGRLDLGAAKVVLQVGRLDRRSFFAQRVVDPEKAVVTSQPLVLEVRDAPLVGRPSSYTGIIGDFRGEAAYGKTTIRAGDGVTLELRLTGPGELESLPLPKLEGFDDFDVYPPDRRVTPATDGNRTLEIGWLLVPRRDREVKELPRFELSWFRPSDGSFATAGVGPEPLVIEGDVADPGIFGGAETARSAREILTLGEGLRPIMNAPGEVRAEAPRVPFVALLVVLVAPLASLFATSWIAARRRRLRGDHALQRRARASRAARERLAEAEAALRGGERGFHAALVRALQGFVGDKLDLPAGRLTASTAADILRPGGADAALSDRVARFLEEMEAKEFGLASGDAEARTRDHAVAEELIRDLDRSLGR